MEKISVKKALIQLLKKTNKETELNEIYLKIHDFYCSTPFQNEPDPKYPYATRLQHAIRHNLYELKKENKISSPQRRYYKINPSLK